MQIELDDEEKWKSNIPKIAFVYSKNINSSESFDYSPFGKYIFKSSLGDFKKGLLMTSDISKWYRLLGLFRSLITYHKDYEILYDKISYEKLPDFCKTLISESVNEISRQCNLDMINSQKISLLTPFKISWDDAISSIRKIESIRGSFLEYSLEEALFILHIKTYKPNFLISFFSSQVEEDMLYYAKCLIAAIYCVLKNEGKIPLEFKLDLSINDNKLCFIKNADILIEQYLDEVEKIKNKLRD